jgi:hypothetical protein
MEVAMQQYPVNGPREPVYALMRGLGFSVANWTDKVWNSSDGIEVSIYGAGSMARIKLADTPKGECELDNLANHIDALRHKE